MTLFIVMWTLGVMHGQPGTLMISHQGYDQASCLDAVPYESGKAGTCMRNDQADAILRRARCDEGHEHGAFTEYTCKGIL